MNPPLISNKATHFSKNCAQETTQAGKELKMPEALPYNTLSQLVPRPKRAKNDFNLNTSLATEPSLEEDEITKLALKNAVIVFGRSGCCLCLVVKRLLQGLGANPVVHQIEDDKLKYFDGIFEEFAGKFMGGRHFPAVYIGGKLYGGLDRVIATHISGELVPLLKQAGALWL